MYKTYEDKCKHDNFDMKQQKFSYKAVLRVSDF